MRITEKRLRSLIRSVIREAVNSDERYARYRDNPAFASFDDENVKEKLDSDLQITSAEDVGQLDHVPTQRGTTSFMRQNRRAGKNRFSDDFDYDPSFDPNLNLVQQELDSEDSNDERYARYRDNPAFASFDDDNFHKYDRQGKMHRSQLDMLDPEERDEVDFENISRHNKMP
tara:strand:- start:1930 stop:2445 length:516 start_codon:yes stop_codon:yes gene_type:complete